jgi:hypothetical protein
MPGTISPRDAINASVWAGVGLNRSSLRKPAMLTGAVICLLGISMVLFLPNGTDAAACDPTLAAIPGADGYKERTNGERCEGLFFSPVSGSAIELVSLTRGPFRYDLKQQPNLSLKLAAPSADAARPSHIRAVGIPLGLYYRMDADILANQTVTWPVKEVLAPNRLTSDQIGIFAFQRDQLGRLIFYPIDVSAPLQRDAYAALH